MVWMNALHRLIGYLLLLAAMPIWADDVLTLTFAYEDKAQPPYYLGEGSAVPATAPGVAVEIVRQLEKRIPQVKVRVERFPWKRCLDQLTSGAVDGIFNASFQEARLAIGTYPMKGGSADPSRRLTTIAYSLYTLGNSPLGWDGTRFANAENVTFGAPLGYSIVKDLRAMKVEIAEAISSETLLKQLVARRIDAAVMQDVTADALIASNPAEFGAIRKHEIPIASKPYYLMLSRQFVARHPALAEQIWKEIAAMRESVLPVLAKQYQNH